MKESDTARADECQGRDLFKRDTNEGTLLGQ